MKPWRINDSIRGRLYIEDDDGLICDMQLEQATTKAERAKVVACAKLIALAPTMLYSIRNTMRSVVDFSTTLKDVEL
jgi:hypothetical protein